MPDALPWTPGTPPQRPPLPRFEPGTVWLVGAGPGDPGLLTLLALRGIEQADVVLYDALIGPDILGMARPDAVLEHAGKRAGRCVAGRQDSICARLIALARAGRRVLRLKGGDPFVFGRGGEEALALAEAGVPFRIVPGVTAGIGGLACAGIPVTLRGVNEAVAFVTGHDSGGGMPESVDWAALARGAPVIVLYMALGTLGEIAARLIAAGRAPDTPVAIVADASLHTQSAVVTDLAACGDAAARLKGKAPAIIAIGEVVRVREALAGWQMGAVEGGTAATGAAGYSALATR